MPCAIDSDDDVAGESTARRPEDELRARLPRMRQCVSRNDVLVCASRHERCEATSANDGGRLARRIVTSPLFAPVGFKKTTVIDADTLRIRDDVVTPAPVEARPLSLAYPYGAPRGLAVRYRRAAYRVMSSSMSASVVLRAAGGARERTRGDASCPEEDHSPALDSIADAREVTLRDARQWTVWSSSCEECVVYTRVDVSGSAFLWRARRGFSVWLFSRDAARLERNMRRDSKSWVGACSAHRRRCASPKYTLVDVASSVETASHCSSCTASPGRET